MAHANMTLPVISTTTSVDNSRRNSILTNSSQLPTNPFATPNNLSRRNLSHPFSNSDTRAATQFRKRKFKSARLQGEYVVRRLQDDRRQLIEFPGTRNHGLRSGIRGESGRKSYSGAPLPSASSSGQSFAFSPTSPSQT